MKESIERYWIKKRIIHYKGSLDFPCNFCKVSSYDNFHFQYDDEVKFVVCAQCLRDELENAS